MPVERVFVSAGSSCQTVLSPFSAFAKAPSFTHSPLGTSASSEQKQNIAIVRINWTVGLCGGREKGGGLFGCTGA